MTDNANEVNVNNGPRPKWQDKIQLVLAHKPLDKLAILKVAAMFPKFGHVALRQISNDRYVLVAGVRTDESEHMDLTPIGIVTTEFDPEDLLALLEGYGSRMQRTPNTPNLPD